MHRPSHTFVCLLLGTGLWTLAGCASDEPPNPSVPVTTDQATAALDQMRANPKPLRRPLVIIGGFLDPNVSPPLFDHFFRGVTGEGKIIPVSVGLCGSFEECRQRVIDAVEKQCPSQDPDQTSEVDVVGASLGGLVARYAAAPSRDPAHPRCLRIARLFSISSPHAGATLASHVGFTDFHRDMRPNSPFMRYLADADANADYQIIPYTRLNDEIVGEQNAAPPGHNPYWLANPPFAPSHLSAMMDPRILGDIARRLRDEEPFTKPTATPLPAP